MAAIFYDCLLLLSVFFFFTLILLPATGGEAIESGNIPYEIYLVLISYFYFLWQWTHGGQTLGMRAWNIKLVGDKDITVTWPDASRRFFLAMISWLMFGAGFLWALFDQNRAAFHDRYSRTRLVINSK